MSETSSDRLEQIQAVAAQVSRARDLLTEATSALRADLEAVRDRKLPDIRAAARQYADLHNRLEALITQSPELFATPRTHVVDGLRFGLMKSQESVQYDDEAALIARIHHLREQEVLSDETHDLLVTTEESVSIRALKKLDPVILAKLGVEIIPGTDQVVINKVDDGVEKAINALIKRSLGDKAAAEVTE